MSKKRIAVCGMSANPPGVHHRRIVLLLSRMFDKVVVVPCGPRPDKEITNDIPPIYRAAMAALTFRGINGVTVDLTDLEKDVFTRTFDLWQRYSQQGEAWLVVGSDLVKGGHKGQSVIQREWHKGRQLWKQAKFVVISRVGFPIVPGQELPPQAELVRANFKGSSTEIRERAFRHESVEGFVLPVVADYMERNALYRGVRPTLGMRFDLDGPRILFAVDRRNPYAVKLYNKLRQWSDPSRANLIVTIGGDGTMLHAVQRYWSRRLPFFGVNAGHRGYLLNEPKDVLQRKFCFNNLGSVQWPLLYVNTISPDGTVTEHLAFNDCWTRTIDGGRGGWTEVMVNGEIFISKLVSDGALVSSVGGSTAYARAMGNTPLPFGSDGLLLVGNNTDSPNWWRRAPLSNDSVITLRTLNPKHRPLAGYIDGINIGPVVQMTARYSWIAAAELVFHPNSDPQAKRTAALFSPV